MPLPPYEKEVFKTTRRMHASWYLSSYKYKFNLKRIRVFLDGLKEGKFYGLKCRSCNTVSFPPRLICGKCMEMPDQWVLLRDTATVATFSATYDRKADPNSEHPIPIVAIRQDGADTTWTALLQDGVNLSEVYVGMPLKAKWAEERTGSLTDIEYYEPIQDPTIEMNKKEQESK
jgi:uncharacterized OB-fold protein